MSAFHKSHTKLQSGPKMLAHLTLSAEFDPHRDGEVGSPKEHGMMGKGRVLNRE